MATPKKTIQDIKIPDRSKPKTAVKRAVKTVRAPRTTRRVAKDLQSLITTERAKVRVMKNAQPTYQEPSDRRPRKKGPWVFVLCIAVFFLGAAYMYGKLFDRATVLITPRHETVAIDTQVTFAKEPAPQQVPLVVMSLSDTVTKTVRATGSAEVSEKASGKIIVYNNFSTSPQKLVEETRFEAPDGKIYKTAKGNPITIPGISNGKPGQIEVTVYAAEPGAEYNKELTDFTIPGFKGTPKYDKFYARSTTAITGGFVGVRSTLPDDERARLVADIGTELGDRLKAEALLQKTDEFIILDQTSKVVLGEPQVVPSDDNPLEARFSISGTYSAVLVNTQELSMRLADDMIQGYVGEPVLIKNIQDLQLSAAIPEGQDIQSLTTLQVHVSGSPLFVFDVPELELKQKLLAMKRKETDAVFSFYPSIQSARLIVRPFWSTRVPADLESIKIRYNLD